jgi:DNA-binding transcriptional MerR regulator
MLKQIAVGELAKQAHVTIRTLQYYDKIGLLKPSSMTDGGRRLYSENDITVLHQIITLKSLGLSLDEIKKRLIPIESNDDIKRMLIKQSNLIKEQIAKANKILSSIEMITNEINDDDTVDWSKYSNMVKLIQDNNESYWVLNYLENDTLEDITHIHEKYSEEELPSDWLVKCMKTAQTLLDSGISPDSEEAAALAKEMWTMVEKYSDGQPEKVQKLYTFFSASDKWPKAYARMHEASHEFLEKAIENYIGNQMMKLFSQEK